MENKFKFKLEKGKLRAYLNGEIMRILNYTINLFTNTEKPGTHTIHCVAVSKDGKVYDIVYDLQTGYTNYQRIIERR